MFDQLLQLVQQHAGDSIVNNPAIPNHHNDAAIQSVTQGIVSELESHASAGNLQGIMALFQSGGNSLASNPMVSNMIFSVAGSFSSKFGVSPANAQNMASSLLPAVMSKFVNQTNDPNNNNFSISNVMKSVTGNGNFDMSSLLGQMTGSGASGVMGTFEGFASKLFGK